MNYKSLPHFERPPVVETVLGVQFTPLPIQSGHLGAFWKSLGPHWPEINDAPRIPTQFETFGPEQSWVNTAELRFEVTKNPVPRIQIRNNNRDRMIQVQQDRFHLNWLGQGGHDYPRYTSVRREFDDHVERFKNFTLDYNLGKVLPNQWEVTYVNRIDKGTVWDTPDDWVHVFRVSVSPRVIEKHVHLTLESLTGELHYRIPDRTGRLHVRFRHVMPKDREETERIEMVLTARGPVEERHSGAETLESGLELGHETIVRAFTDLTSTRAHQFWGLIDDDT